MRIKRTQRVIVKGVIFNKNNSLVLLLKTKHGYWDLPGGCLKFNETPEECLQRETKEEIGQKLDVIGLSSIQTILLDGTDKKGKPEKRHYLVLVYRCSIKRFIGIANLNDKKIIGWKWFPLKQVIKREKAMPVVSILKEQLLSNAKEIKTYTKSFFKIGELKAYREERYK